MGRVEIKRNVNGIVEWDWVGDNRSDIPWKTMDQIVHMPLSLEPGDQVWIGPYRVLIVDTPENTYSQYYTVHKVSTDMEVAVALLRIRLEHLVSETNRRILRTLAIWGLLDARPGEVLSWGKVKFIGRFFKNK